MGAILVLRNAMGGGGGVGYTDEHRLVSRMCML